MMRVGSIRGRTAAWMLVVLLPVSAMTACTSRSQGETRTLFERESLYHYVRVVEQGDVRYLQFRRSGSDYDESAIRLSDPLDFPLNYYRLMFAGLAHHPEPKRVLFVGLGGGTLPRALHHYFPQAKIDVIELDEIVVDAAVRYFGFPLDDPQIDVYIRDARVQINRFVREKRTYDLIFLDAFRGGYIPYHLTTREFFEAVRSILDKNGVVVSNLQAGFRSYDYHRRTLAAVFRNDWSYGDRANVIVVDSNEPNPPSHEELVARARQLQEKLDFRFHLPSIVEAGGVRDNYQRSGRILTDDYAPTDVLRNLPRE